MRPNTVAGAWRPVAYPNHLAAQNRRLDRPHSRETRSRRVRAAIACAAFLALIGSSFWAATKGSLSGVRMRALSAFGVKAPVTPAEPSRVGRITYELPDGLFCTYVPFDNITRWIGDPTTTICEEIVRKQQRGGRPKFSWGD